MKTKVILAATLLVLSASGPALLAATTSDREKGFDFSKLRTWDFKDQKRMAQDPLGPNSIWDNRIHQALQGDLQARGLERATSTQPDFLVAYYMGTAREYDSRIIGYGFPGGWRRWGWGRGWRDYQIWNIPYTESTLVLDIIDASTNQLVWRGYDTEAIDLNKADRSIRESVDKLVKRFVKESGKES